MNMFARRHAYFEYTDETEQFARNSNCRLLVSFLMHKDENQQLAFKLYLGDLSIALVKDPNSLNPEDIKIFSGEVLAQVCLLPTEESREIFLQTLALELEENAS